MRRPDRTALAGLRPRGLVSVVLISVVSLAGVNWVLDPGRALRWLRFALLLPTLWLGLAVWHGATLRSLRRRGIDDTSAVLRYFTSALALAILAVGSRQVVVLALEIWHRTGGHGGAPKLEHRILGLTTSAVFLVIGNALPKILTPLSMLSREQAERVTVARRFLGRTMVVLGMVTGLAFVLLPLTVAAVLLRWATVTFFLATLGAIAWMNAGGSRSRA